MAEFPTRCALRRGPRPVAVLCIALALGAPFSGLSAEAENPPVQASASASALAALSSPSSKATSDEDSAWPLVASEAGTIAREHLFRGSANDTQLGVRLACWPATKAMTISIRSFGADGSASNFLSAAERGGGYPVPVGRIMWGGNVPAGNLWDYFHNEASGNVTTWRLDISDYVTSHQAPDPGDFIGQLLPLRFQVINAQGAFVLTIPEANRDIESLLGRCAAFPIRSKALPSVTPAKAEKPQDADAVAVAAYVAQVLAAVAQRGEDLKSSGTGK